MSNLFISLEQYRAMCKKHTDANVLQIVRKLLRPEDLKTIEAEEKAGALSTPPQAPVTPAPAITAGEAPKCDSPAHKEIPLHELDSDVLGLDPLDENDARLMDAIT